MKPSIIFVDDEPNILDALKRLLYPMRQTWDMTFCLGALQALKILAKKKHDILVTDLLMPDMDGGKLLEEVHTRHPDMTRIVLSGHSGNALALKASRYAHQFLAKPVQSEELKRAIERVVTLREVFVSPCVQKLITRIDTLPTLPDVHRRIMAELNAPEPSMKLVADLISQDMGLSVSMLKLVNSAFFGLRTKVSSPTHAVNLLGLDVISGLVLTVQLFSRFDATQHKGYDLDRLWKHCLSTGCVCKALAQAEGFNQTEQDELYVTGLLHDVGKLILLCSDQDVYETILATCRKDNIAIWRAERDQLECTHAELGAYLLGLWGLSDKTITSVFHHHHLMEYPGDMPLHATIVHVANALDHELNVENPHYDRNRWDLDAIDHFGFADRLPVWKKYAEAALKEACSDEHENSDS